MELQEAEMREALGTAGRHWVSAILFVVYWLVAAGWSVAQVQTGAGELSRLSIALLILAPVLAGGLIGSRGGWTTVACGCGATISIVNFALLLNLYLVRFPPTAPHSAAMDGLLVPIAVPGVIGGLLGLAGALGGRFLAGRGGGTLEKGKAGVVAY